MSHVVYTKHEIMNITALMNNQSLSRQELTEVGDRYFEICLNLTKRLSVLANQMYIQKYFDCEKEQYEFDNTYFILRRMRHGTKSD